MKRQKDLVLEIATVLRDADDSWLSLGKIEVATGDDLMPARTTDYHVRLMRDAGFVSVDGARVRLTWAGHDYLDENGPSKGLTVANEQHLSAARTGQIQKVVDQRASNLQL